MSDVFLKDLYGCPELHSDFGSTIYDYNGFAAKVIPTKESSDPLMHRWLQEQQSTLYSREIRFHSLAGPDIAPEVFGLVWCIYPPNDPEVTGFVMLKCRALDLSVNMAEKKRIMEGMQLAVGRLHGKGILHGDVKLENFVQAPDGRIFLCDFETAAFIHEARVSLMMTTRHASPRRLKNLNKPLNITDDICALRITVYKLFTGQLPYPELRDSDEADDRIRDADEPFDTSLVQDEAVRAFIDRSLAAGSA